MLTFRQLSILPNIKEFSGAEKIERGYLIKNNFPAFFYLSFAYAKYDGFYLRVYNPNKAPVRGTFLFLSHNTNSSFLKDFLLPQSAAKDIYIPSIFNCLSFEAYAQNGDLLLENLSILNYKQSRQSRNLNSILHFTLSSSPAGAIKFSKEGPYIVALPAQSVEGVLTPKITLSPTDVFELKINSPAGVKILNSFGLYDIIQGEVLGKYSYIDFSPAFINFKTNPDNVTQTATHFQVVWHSYYSSNLEKYLDGSLS